MNWVHNDKIPGDIIITGTPSGVGPVMPGDNIEI